MYSKGVNELSKFCSNAYPKPPILRCQTHLYCLKCAISAEYYSEKNCSVCGFKY